MALKFFSLLKNPPKESRTDSLRVAIENARALHQQGRTAESIALFQEIIASNPDAAQAHYRHANALKDHADYPAALAAYDRAIALVPDHAHAYCNRAVALGLMGRIPDALASYERALAIDPGDALSHANRALLLIGLGRRDEALTGLEAAITHDPRHFQAQFARAALLQERKDWSAALDGYDAAIALNPGDAACHANRGTVLVELERWDPALESFDRAIALKDHLAQAHAGRANVLQELRRDTAALASYDRAIELNPRDAIACNNRGVLLHRMGRFSDALASYDHALRVNPRYAEAHFNRGTLLKALEDPTGALANFDSAIAAKPHYPEAFVNRGTVLGELDRRDEAAASYEQAIAMDPELDEAYYNLAMAQLRKGDYEKGWRHFEWRWRAKGGHCFAEKRDFEAPLWLGAETIRGKTIFLYGEQGLGDSLQFCRYVEMVAALGAQVVLEVPEPLVDLCKTLSGVERVLAFGGSVPRCDFQCPLMSLPLAFGTTLASIPSKVPYLRSEPAKVSEWESRLGRKTKPRIGLTWSGNQAAGTNRNRHFPLSLLKPHLGRDFEYYCLQGQIAKTDERTLAETPEILQFGEGIRGFAATAALCECMDLVISVDTSIAHLAGALGKRTWVVLPLNSEWRWLTERDDSPWYPTMTLFRQRSADDWAEVLERVFLALRTQFPGS
jgi:tetratricopeptide (TPR) repeat protein